MHGTAARASSVQCEPVTSAVGAIVSNVDLAAEMSAETASAIRKALHHFGVLFFYGQDISTDAQVELASRFGQIYRHPLATNDSLPDVTVLDNIDATIYGTSGGSTGWHSDATFEKCPPYLAILKPVLLPTLGGDTLWASSCASYEGLSSRMQRMIEGLEGVHDAGPISRQSEVVTARPIPPPVRHPVVIEDTVTSRRSLFINPNYTQRLVGVSDSESRALLAALFAHMVAPEFQVRLRWRSGYVVMWNERTTMHYGVGDYTGRRIMHRVIVAGGEVVHAR